MSDYYVTGLSGARLRRCYEVAPPRVQQYLAAELDFVLENIAPNDHVLELGCGYGRVLTGLLTKASYVVGIDTARGSLLLARALLTDPSTCGLAQMDATSLGIRDQQLDLVVCVQNGISAFGVDPQLVVTEAIRVARIGGKVLLSTYLDQFWDHRLEWFEIQAEHGLVGKIDYDATGNGVIVCQDGFRAGALAPEAFASLIARHDVTSRIIEVDGSSLVCELVVGDRTPGEPSRQSRHDLPEPPGTA